MQTVENPAAQKLLEAFHRFRRLHWRESPVTGLTPGEIILLSSVNRAAPSDGTGVKVSEISNLLHVASPTVTQQVNDLEANGYVERSMDREDRRVVRVTLTPKGECAVEKAHQAFISSFSGLVEYLGEEQSNQLADLLSKVYTYFNEVRSKSYEL